LTIDQRRYIDGVQRDVAAAPDQRASATRIEDEARMNSRSNPDREMQTLDVLRALRWLAIALFCACGVATAADSPAPPANNYRLASGDAIRVVVFQNPDMTLETRVSEDGSISYPLVGTIALDIGSAERKIAKALQDGGFLKQPQVNIELVKILGNKIAVLGQVNKPGAYPLETFNMRVSQLLAEAGGLSASGADRMILTGTRDGKPYRREIDVDALYKLDQTDQDVPVSGGDTIYVPRAATFYIYGEVARPGSYRIDRNMTMRQALAAGGGLTARGTERRLRVVRRNAQGVPEKTSADLNDPVSPDDVIYVNESIF
jgi:polysaccharide export outer membrane protein